MIAEEMDNMFDVLYNNITSTQAPGLNAYEKSIFLTKAQDEIVKNYFNPKSKGNTTQEGFDDNPKRQIDFSMLTSVYTVVKDRLIPGETGGSIVLSTFENPVFDDRDNVKSVKLPTDVMFILNEVVKVTRGTDTATLQVIPIKYTEYSRLMLKPYKRPIKYQAWRLINSNNTRNEDIIAGPSDTLEKYILRYIKKPAPIIVSDLEGLTIDGEKNACDCKLDLILHEEIVQRAVELAKIAWASTTVDGTQLFTQAGQRSE